MRDDPLMIANDASVVERHIVTAVAHEEVEHRLGIEVVLRVPSVSEIKREETKKSGPCRS